MSGKTVLEIQGAVGPGGSERHTLILAKGLHCSGGLDVVIAGPYSRNQEMFREIQSLAIPCYEVDMEHKARLAGSMRSIVQVVQEHHVDVIHSHLRNADLYGVVVGALTRTPVVVTLHGRTGPLDGTSSVRSRLAKLVHAYLIRHGARTVIAISEFVKAYNVSDLGLDPGKVQVVHNCTETRRFDAACDVASVRRELGVQPHQELVSLIGGISRQKGAHHFVELADLIVKTQADTRFLVAGQGDFEDEMKERVRGRGLAHHFVFAGWRPDVPQLMHATDVLVMAAYQEGFGRVVTEAMAASKPVVAFASGGVSEIIVHGQTGYLVPYGDVESMAAYVLELIQDKARATTLGRYGRQRLETHFSVQAFVERTRHILELAAQRGDG
jgi:glycosyltransferase involved in cell wall biosynthesis